MSSDKNIVFNSAVSFNKILIVFKVMIKKNLNFVLLKWEDLNFNMLQSYANLAQPQNSEASHVPVLKWIEVYFIYLWII